MVRRYVKTGRYLLESGKFARLNRINSVRSRNFYNNNNDRFLNNFCFSEVCSGGELPEVEIVSLLEEQIPKYTLRADTLTEFGGMFLLCREILKMIAVEHFYRRIIKLRTHLSNRRFTDRLQTRTSSSFSE